MPDIRHAILIGAPAEKVYDALTSQQGLAAWWTPEVTALPEAGTVARFAFGPEYHKEMKIAALVPAQQVKWRCTAGAAEWLGTSVSFRLHKSDRRALRLHHPALAGQLEQMPDVQELTVLRFAHDGWENYTAMFAECNYTWALFLHSLKLYCETGTGRPWPQQHTVLQSSVAE